MYVNPFIAGVLSTLFVEAVGLIVAAYWWNKRR